MNYTNNINCHQMKPLERKFFKFVCRQIDYNDLSNYNNNLFIRPMYMLVEEFADKYDIPIKMIGNWLEKWEQYGFYNCGVGIYYGWFENMDALILNIPIKNKYNRIINKQFAQYIDIVPERVKRQYRRARLEVDIILSLNSEDPYSAMLYEDDKPTLKQNEVKVIDKYRDLYSRTLREMLKSFEGTVIVFKVKPGESHQEGEMYWCGYWEKRYRVINKDGYHITVEWVDGKITTHSTALDPRHDFRLELLNNTDFNHVINICQGLDSGQTTDSIRGAEIKMAILNGYFNEEVGEDIYYALYNLKYELNDSVYYYISRKSGFVRFYRDENKSPRKK